MAVKGALVMSLAACLQLLSQEPCANAPVYSPCEFVFELSDQDAAANPNPYKTVELRGEFRSPGFDTLAMPAFWDGGRRIVLRFTPTEAGNWTYRLTSNLRSLDGKIGNFTAVASGAPGFVEPRNVHHWAYAVRYTQEVKPHLWMGDTSYRFAFMDQSLFQRVVDTRAAQKFNHIRGLVLGSAQEAARIVPAPDRVDPAHFRELDERIRYMNGKGITVDLILGGADNQLAKLLPQPADRESYIRYLVARYAPMNITWQGVDGFETYDNGRALLKEVGALLTKMDPYRHPRTSATRATSGSLLDDGWMNFVAHESPENSLGAIEHQLFAVPFVNLNFGAEESGAGRAAHGAVDSDTFRRRLWNAAMNGQYVTYANTGTDGRGAAVDAAFLDAPAAKQMTVWYNFFDATRHWELEPYFDVDGGRALALEGVEYVVYVERPGPVEVLVEKHGYDVAWFNPISGETIRQKGFKGEHYTGEPPDRSHDWVLHISREGHKEGMLRSYKFESRRIEMQVIDQNSAKVPFEIAQPSQSPLPIGKTIPLEARITRPTHATRSMMWLWIGDVTATGKGYRVIGTEAKGSFTVPPLLVENFPAVFSIRLYGMNAVGKVYSLDKPYQLAK